MKRRGLVVLLGVLGVLSALALVLVGRWLNETKVGGQGYAQPFRIAGNFYYVGATDLAAYLITGPEGHVVLDGGMPTTAKMIMASIAELGFDIMDVKVLLHSDPRPEHAGGLGVLQQASGAELWASEASADIHRGRRRQPRLRPAVEGPHLDRDPGLPGHARRPSVQGRRHDPGRADRAHRARHWWRRARLHLVVVPRPRP